MKKVINSGLFENKEFEFTVDSMSLLNKYTVELTYEDDIIDSKIVDISRLYETKRIY